MVILTIFLFLMSFVINVIIIKVMKLKQYWSQVTGIKNEYYYLTYQCLNSKNFLKKDVINKIFENIFLLIKYFEILTMLALCSIFMVKLHELCFIICLNLIFTINMEQ